MNTTPLDTLLKATLPIGPPPAGPKPGAGESQGFNNYLKQATQSQEAPVKPKAPEPWRTPAVDSQPVKPHISSEEETGSSASPEQQVPEAHENAEHPEENIEDIFAEQPVDVVEFSEAAVTEVIVPVEFAELAATAVIEENPEELLVEEGANLQQGLSQKSQTQEQPNTPATLPVGEFAIATDAIDPEAPVVVTDGETASGGTQPNVDAVVGDAVDTKDEFVSGESQDDDVPRAAEEVVQESVPTQKRASVETKQSATQVNQPAQQQSNADGDASKQETEGQHTRGKAGDSREAPLDGSFETQQTSEKPILQETIEVSVEKPVDTNAVPTQRATVETIAAPSATPNAGASQTAITSSTPHSLVQQIETATTRTDAQSPVSTVDRARFVQRVAGAFRVAQQNDGEIQLRLSPPELGSLKIEISIRNGVLSANLETETSEARRIVLDNLPALRQRLAEQDIRIEKFDVDVRRDGGDSGSQTGAQDRQREQESSRATSVNRMRTARGSAERAVRSQSALVEGGLDVRI